MRIEMLCRDCKKLEIVKFARPSKSDQLTRPDYLVPHHYRCRDCGGVLDPTDKGLDDLARLGGFNPSPGRTGVATQP